MDYVRRPNRHRCHRQRLKKGFEPPVDGKKLSVDDAFKDPKHPFRVAIVCAMWLTGFDVECLQTLYIDKPLRAHTLMQAIARANRIYPGKDCGLIVDTADVTVVLKELHRIVNAAIRASGPGDDHAEGLTVDLSQIDFERLRKEFAKRKRKNTTIKDIRDVVEQKLQQMVNNNPMRMDYYRRYQEIIADYNREKDRATVEQTFAALVKLAGELDDEQLRAVNEGLSQAELALFDLLRRENLTKADLERLKQASRMLLARLHELLAPMAHWTRNAQTQAEVETRILDWLNEFLPRPPFTDSETDSLAKRVYGYVWQRSQSGGFATEASSL